MHVCTHVPIQEKKEKKNSFSISLVLLQVNAFLGYWHRLSGKRETSMAMAIAHSTHSTLPSAKP